MIDEIISRYDDEDILKADGLDEAVIGIDERSMRLIYSVTKCIAIFMKEMPEDDAKEYFEFNVAGAWMGDKTPIWCYD